MYVDVYRRLEDNPGVITKAATVSSIDTESLTTLELAKKDSLAGQWALEIHRFFDYSVLG